MQHKWKKCITCNIIIWFDIIWILHHKILWTCTKSAENSAPSFFLLRESPGPAWKCRMDGWGWDLRVGRGEFSQGRLDPKKPSPRFVARYDEHHVIKNGQKMMPVSDIPSSIILFIYRCCWRWDAAKLTVHMYIYVHHVFHFSVIGVIGTTMSKSNQHRIRPQMQWPGSAGQLVPLVADKLYSV